MLNFTDSQKEVIKIFKNYSGGVEMLTEEELSNPENIIDQGWALKPTSDFWEWNWMHRANTMTSKDLAMLERLWNKIA